MEDAPAPGPRAENTTRARLVLPRGLRVMPGLGLCVLCGLTALPCALAAPPPDLAVAARSILGAAQGVYVETADGTVLVAQAAERSVHPASVSKVPTTLALLKKFGPAYRFTTSFTAQGRILDGTLEGDLLVDGDGDPSLVDEDALLIAARLNQLGIHRIAGALRAAGTWTFDWQTDPDGARLARALAGTVAPAAWSAVEALGAPLQTPPAGTAAARPAADATPAHIEFLPAAPGLTTTALTPATEATAAGTLLVFRSEPLLSMLKALDDYSNNIMAPLAQEAGGAAAVQALARGIVPAAMRSEIILADGAGEDPRNRMSPRAAVRLLRALEQELGTTGHTLTDVLPVAGVDVGTLHDRLNGPAEAGRVVGKTGTYGSYGASALVGAIPTVDRGTVYFAILNHGVPVPEARRRQDRFVRVLLGHLHTRTWTYQRDPRPAVARAQLSPR